METLYTIGAIVACILLFSFAIFIHEFGHFIAARIFGLAVETFSIGFGPALWKKKIGDIEYRISAFPLGGYVALPQLDPEGTKGIQGSNGAPDAPTLPECPAWKRIIVAFAGPFGNIVLAVVLAFALAAVPDAHFGVLAAKIGYVPEDGPAAEAGLIADDEIKAVNGHAIDSWVEMQTEIQLTGGAECSFDVLRGGTNIVISVTPKRDKVTGAYYILAVSKTNETHSVAWMPDRNPMKQLIWDAGQISRIVKALFTPGEAGAAAKALGGPVMIAQGLYHQVRSNVWDAFGFLRFLNVNLAILNLLPFPVLDGGLILFALYELLFRRRPNKKFTDIITRIFMYLLIALMLTLVWRDVARTVRVHRAGSKSLVDTVADERTNSVERASGAANTTNSVDNAGGAEKGK